MKRTSLFRRVISVVLSLSLTFGIFAIMPGFEADATATHYSGYSVRVRIEVRNDADGWNSAYMTVTGAGGYNGFSGYSSTTLTFNDLQGYIDHNGGVYDNTFNFGTSFPTQFDIYTDFGGGITWRCFEADVYIYVNGVNVKSQHIVSESSAFSTSDDHNYVSIDRSNYPYPAEISVAYADTADNLLPSIDNYGTFYQDANSNCCSGRIRTCAYDQYGCVWYGLPTVTNVTNSGTDTMPYFDSRTGSNYKYYYYDLQSTLGTDHTSRYKCTYTTNNSVYQTKEYSFDTEFTFLHKVDITVNGETVSTLKE